VHWPSLRKVAAFIREYRPHYVIDGGDWLEASAPSVWPNEDPWTLEDEFESCNEGDELLLDAAPDAEHWRVEGNHDFRIRAPNRFPKNIRDSLDYRTRLKHFHHFKFVPYNFQTGNALRLGQLTVIHGYRQGANGPKYDCLEFGVDNGLFVSGDSHKPHAVRQVRVNTSGPYLPRFYANTGTLGPLNPTFMNKKSKQEWGRAFAYGEVRLGRRLRASRDWTCKVEILQAADGTVAHDFEPTERPQAWRNQS
jgi:hypothetical protein